jgi:hypothetical protein
VALASKFQYKPRSAEQVEKRLNRTGGSFQGYLRDDYKLFKPAVGENFIRFLPPTWDDAEHWGYEVHVHYNVGPERASVLCLAKMEGKKCPICEAQAAARKAGDEELAKELAPRMQVISWIMNMKDTATGPQLYSVSFRMDSDFIKLTRDRESGEIYQIDNPEEGYNVSYQREGTTQTTTKYSGFQLGRKPSAIQEDWLEYVVAHPVPETLVRRDYDEVKALFEGKGAAAETDDTKPAETAAEPARPKLVSKIRKPEPEQVSEPENETTEPEAKAAPEKPEPNTTAAASGMSKAEELRAKLAARKAAAK